MINRNVFVVVVVVLQCGNIKIADTGKIVDTQNF